jgi:hypothetical protein
MSNIYNNINNNLDSSFNNLSIKDDENKIFIYDEKNCINKSTFQDYYNIAKLNTFLNNSCLININTKAHHCDECNKDIGFNDYLYYNKEYKYKITELYYHKIKNHGYEIEKNLIDLI